MTDEEIDQALGALRADVPGMDARTFAAGRARLVAAIGMPPVAAPADRPEEAVVVALPADRRRRSPPPRRAMPWLGVAAAVAVVATGAFALLPGDSAVTAPPGATTSTNEPPAPNHPPEPGRPGEPLPAMPAEPINTAGDLAAKATDVQLRPGQVRYVRSARTQDRDANGPGGSDTIELWIPYDHEGEWLRRRTASGRIQGRSEEDFVEKRAPGGRFDGQESQSPWAPGNMATLPRDPAALYERLRTEVNAELPPGTGTSKTAAQEATGTVFSMLGDVTGGVPADLRAALLRTLGYLPGVTVTPNAEASDGRAAVALGYEVDDGMYRNEILLDPATARLVEWRNVALREFNGFQPNQAFTSELRTEAVVTELGQQP